MLKSIRRIGYHFNPRSLAGATTIWRTSSRLAIFQSTLPRGSDRCQDLCPAAPHNFNPRSLAGATTALTLTISERAISIHAPSRERLCPAAQAANHLRHFNPRSLAGATYRCREDIVPTKYFNPRSLAGATLVLHW